MEPINTVIVNDQDPKASDLTVSMEPLSYIFTFILKYFHASNWTCYLNVRINEHNYQMDVSLRPFNLLPTDMFLIRKAICQWEDKYQDIILCSIIR